MQESHSMSWPGQFVTAEELERLPSDEGRYELVDGQLVPMSPVGYQHGRVVMRLGAWLDQHVRSQRLGAVVTEVGFVLSVDPDTVRAPDLAFLRRGRIPSVEPRGFWRGAPDLAIEVLSPEDRPAEVQRKVKDYLAHDVPMVLVVDADVQTVIVHRASGFAVTLAGRDVLDIDDVVSGFRCRVQEIFE